MAQRGRTWATGPRVVLLRSAFSPPRMFAARRSLNIALAGTNTAADRGRKMSPIGALTRLLGSRTGADGSLHASDHQYPRRARSDPSSGRRHEQGESPARRHLPPRAHSELTIISVRLPGSHGRGTGAMGSLQWALSWLIVVAVGLAPMLVYWVVSIIVLAIGRTTRRRRAESPAGLAAGTGVRAKGRSSSRASGEAAEPHPLADSHVALPVAARAPGTSPAEPPT